VLVEVVVVVGRGVGDGAYEAGLVGVELGVGGREDGVGRADYRADSGFGGGGHGVDCLVDHVDLRGLLNK